MKPLILFFSFVRLNQVQKNMEYILQYDLLVVSQEQLRFHRLAIVQGKKGAI